MKEAPMKVTVNGPDLSGDYVVAEQRDDGTLVLRPEASEEVIEQYADRVLTEDEFLGSLDRLHAARLREEG
jgi:regulator of RNase E activity RraA